MTPCSIPHGQNNGLEGREEISIWEHWGNDLLGFDDGMDVKLVKKETKRNFLWSFCEVQVKLNLELNEWVKSRGHLRSAGEGRGKSVVLLGGRTWLEKHTAAARSLCSHHVTHCVIYNHLEAWISLSTGKGQCVHLPYLLYNIRCQYLKSLDNLKITKRETEKIVSPVNRPQVRKPRV